MAVVDEKLKRLRQNTLEQLKIWIKEKRKKGEKEPFWQLKPLYNGYRSLGLLPSALKHP